MLKITRRLQQGTALRHTAFAHNGTSQDWWALKAEERLPTTSSTFQDEENSLKSKHPSQRFVNILSDLRSNYPNSIWNEITRLFPNRKKEHTVCIDIAVGAEGRAGVELSKRGFNVIGIEADARMLASTFEFAQSRYAHIELVTAKVEKSLLHSNSAHLVSFFHGLHLVDTAAALNEAYRLLKPSGYLIAAFNDRDLSSDFIQELEDIMEHHITSYNRYQKQRTIDTWGEKLQEGNNFKLVEYSVHQNPIPMANPSALIDVLDCFSFVRANLHGESRKRFNNDVRALLERRFGRKSFMLPLETKMYILRTLKTSLDEEEDTPHHPHGDGGYLSGAKGGHGKHHTIFST